MPRILLTAFEPFGGEKINPSLEIAQQLASRPDVDTITVPVTFADSANTVLPQLPGHDAVVMLGQAKGRKGITVERVAINIDDAAAPDNAGAVLTDHAIAADGPAAYFSTLPIKSMVEAIRAEGLTASVSNSAGTYVCNHLMYSVLHALRNTNIPAGFIHVPALPEQAIGQPHIPTMTLEEMVRSIGAALNILQ